MIVNAPGREHPAFRCPRCGNDAAQEWDILFVESYEQGSTWSSHLDTEAPIEPALFAQLGGQPRQTAADPRSKWVAVAQWARSRCFTCKQSLVWHDEEIVYPHVSNIPAPHADMAPRPKELYVEAAAVAAVSPRAGAAMARATLERLLVELDEDAPARSKLDQRIARIESRVSTSLLKALTIVRHVGNKALHIEDAPDDALVLVLDDDSTKYVGMLFAIVNDLVDELVSKPAARDEWLAEVPKEVLEAAERTRVAVAAQRAAAAEQDAPTQ